MPELETLEQDDGRNRPCKRSRGSRPDDPAAYDDDVGVAAHGEDPTRRAGSAGGTRSCRARRGTREGLVRAGDVGAVALLLGRLDSSNGL